MISALLLASTLDRATAAYTAGDFAAAQTAYARAMAEAPNDAAAADPATASQAHRYLDQVKMRGATFAPGPYDAALGTRTLRIPFAQRDPLPIIAVVVNGKPAHFLIDTGAPDLIVDPAFAKEAGATLVADGVGTFAGGRQAAVSRTTLAAFSIGGVVFPDVAPARSRPAGSGSAEGRISTGSSARAFCSTSSRRWTTRIRS